MSFQQLMTKLSISFIMIALMPSPWRQILLLLRCFLEAALVLFMRMSGDDARKEYGDEESSN